MLVTNGTCLHNIIHFYNEMVNYYTIPLQSSGDLWLHGHLHCLNLKFCTAIVNILFPHLRSSLPYFTPVCPSMQFNVPQTLAILGTKFLHLNKRWLQSEDIWIHDPNPNYGITSVQVVHAITSLFNDVLTHLML